MRILAVTNLFPNPWHPSRATFNRQQFRAVAARNALRVIAPIAWTDELAARWRGGGHLPADRCVECDGIVVEHPRYIFPPRVLRNWYGHCFRQSIGPAFARALACFRPDVVLGSWAYPDGWAAIDLARRAGLPVVTKVHGSDIHLVPRGSARWTRTAHALRQADGVVAVSQDLAERVVAMGVRPERVRVIYNGVDGELFRPGPRAEARRRLGLKTAGPMLLFIGNLAPVKGLDVLLDACGLLRQQGVDLTCFIVGQGPLRETLERRAALELEGRVRFVGAKPHRELPDWFRAASVLVLPSRSEGVPNVLLEACACRTPYVASAVGGIQEISHLGDGRLVPPGDPRALAAAIQGQLTYGAGRWESAATAMRSHADAAAELTDFLEMVTSNHRRKLGNVA